MQSYEKNSILHEKKKSSAHIMEGHPLFIYAIVNLFRDDIHAYVGC